MRLSIVCAAIFALSAGCGLGLTDERSGGADDLPTLGGGPYNRVQPDAETPADEPIVIGDLRLSFEDPSALARAGGGFRLWFGRIDLSDADLASEIWYAELSSLGELPVLEPELALAASEAWEAGRVSAPHVVDMGGGDLVMFYEAGDPADPAIGRADSSDDGSTWQKHATNPVLSGLGSPTAIALDGEWTLFGTHPDREGIFRADGIDGLAWDLVPEPIVTARPDVTGAFDRFQVGDPFAVAIRSPADRVYYGLFFNGADGPNEDSDIAVGYAGSFDTQEWDRFMGIEPVLITRERPVEGPTVVIEPTRGFMFFHEIRGGRGKIIAATHR
jgi:hypothetical protein